MNQKIPFRFSELKPKSRDHKHEFFTPLKQGIDNKSELFKNFYEIFKFPGYFGFNWNALYDCLTDFHWIEIKAIVLFHEDLPSLEEEELKIYLNLMRDVVFSWRDDDQHSFEVIFPKYSQERITALLENQSQ